MKISTLVAVVAPGVFEFSFVSAAHQLHQRSALPETPPLSQSGYTVPTQGSLTCTLLGTCKSTLPSPPVGKTLQYLTLARGINTFICTGQDKTDAPLFQSQIATLWDAAPLLPHIPSEEAFHTLTPQLLKFNYAALTNSSLICIGGITTYEDQYLIDLFDIASFSMTYQDTINPPEHAADDMQWAHGASLDSSWEVYRVETAGGSPPRSCAAHGDSILVDYAAEYWFYH